MKLTWRRATRTLKWPFQTARGRRYDQTTIIITLEHNGITAYGEACPYAYYGHTLESIEGTLQIVARRMRDANPFHIEHIIDDLLAVHDEQRSTVAAIDMALHDWVGKKLGVPVTSLLGLDPARAPLTDLTIGIDTPDVVAQKVREAESFPIFKVKVGVPEEVDILRRLRELAPDKIIRVDANCGWSADDAAKRMLAICEFNPQLIEQPVERGDYDTLRKLREISPVPIIADESCVRPSDIPLVAGCVTGINIKLNKCGGIREARRMINFARSMGLRVMIGCTSESAVGVSAAAQLAPLADWIDLDTHMLVKDDEFTGLGGDGGRLTIGAGPGLGVVKR